MNRRKFLKGLLVAPLALAIPTKPVVTVSGPFFESKRYNGRIYPKELWENTVRRSAMITVKPDYSVEMLHDRAAGIHMPYKTLYLRKIRG